jgi:quercetin dioxygenase-like cupin family protein
MDAAVVRPADARRTETPNAIMTTLASPSLGGPTTISLWRVAIAAGDSGPDHTFDSDQIWHLVSGSATFVVNGNRLDLDTGDTIRIAGHAARQVAAARDAEFVVCGRSDAQVSTPTGSHTGTPAWIS